MHVELILLRIIHVVGGVFWVGSALFNALFLFPALAQAGPAGGQIVQGIQKRGMMVTLPTVAILTMLSGIRLIACGCRRVAHEYHDGSVSCREVRHDGRLLKDELLWAV